MHDIILMKENEAIATKPVAGRNQLLVQVHCQSTIMEMQFFFLDMVIKYRQG